MDESRTTLFSTEAEQALVGSALINPSVLEEVDVEPGHFFIQRLGVVWRAMGVLSRGETGLDILTLAELLERSGQLEFVGGVAYLMELMNATPTSLHAPEYARIIRDYARRRGFITLAEKMAKLAYDLAVPLVEKLPEVVDELLVTAEPEKGAVHISETVEKLVQEVEERRANPSAIWGMSTGYVDFDRYTGGLQTGEVMNVSGEPGVGKSIFTMQMAFQLAEAGYQVVIYSLEMPAVQVLRRRVSWVAKIITKLLKQGSLKDDQMLAFRAAAEAAAGLPLYISDSVHWTTATMRADLARLRAVHGIRWFVLDYAYLLNDGRSQSESDRTGAISGQLKGICRALDVAGIVINSMNKAGFGRTELGGEALRGSAQQAFDADLILFLTKTDDPNVIQATFGKGRELETPGLGFELVRLPGFPAFGEQVQASIPVQSWQSRKDVH